MPESDTLLNGTKAECLRLILTAHSILAETLPNRMAINLGNLNTSRHSAGILFYAAFTIMSLEVVNDGDSLSLDLFSTSPTLLRTCASEVLSLLPEIDPYCDYNAPFFAYKIEGRRYGVTQGCCNHWDCPRCGKMRARREYGRMIEGVRQLSRHNILYFITITCKGKELSSEQAEAGYLEWTNRFLDACNKRGKRRHQEWSYVQVTERQKRGHPHSHILTTFCPMDLQGGLVEKWVQGELGNMEKRQVASLRSNWLAGQVVKSGLGEQYDISFVESAEGASRYVAKYLFKQSMFETNWPKGWRRVRYSQSFPKLPAKKTDAFVLLSANDWLSLAKKAVVVNVSDRSILPDVQHYLKNHDVLIVDKP